MTTSTTTEPGLNLTPPVIARINEVTTYIALMQRERAGWGPDAEREVTETMASWIRALSNLLGAHRVWCEGVSRPLDSGRPELSFGGDMTGGNYFFGVLSRIQTSKVRDSEGTVLSWTYPPLEWSFHS